MNKNIEQIEEYLDELLENKFQSIKEQNLNIEIKKIYFQKHLDESISIDKLFLNLSLGALAFLSTLIFKIDFKNIIDTWNILSIIFGSTSALLFLCVVDAELFEIIPKNKALMLLIVGKSNIYDEPSEEEKKLYKELNILDNAVRENFIAGVVFLLLFIIILCIIEI